MDLGHLHKHPCLISLPCLLTCTHPLICHSCFLTHFSRNLVCYLSLLYMNLLLSWIHPLKIRNIFRSTFIFNKKYSLIYQTYFLSPLPSNFIEKCAVILSNLSVISHHGRPVRLTCHFIYWSSAHQTCHWWPYPLVGWQSPFSHDLSIKCCFLSISPIRMNPQVVLPTPWEHLPSLGLPLRTPWH